MLKKYLNLFEGKDDSKQLDIMEQMMLSAGFKEEVAKYGETTETRWFSKEGCENVFAIAKHGDKELPLILPADFAEATYKKNGKFCKVICIQGHGYKNETWVARYKSEGLHRCILRFHGVDVDGFEVDHIYCTNCVNVYEGLRLCNSPQNKANKKTTKNTSETAFAYDPLNDFSECLWIPFLHYVLGVITKEDMRKLRKLMLTTV